MLNRRPVVMDALVLVIAGVDEEVKESLVGPNPAFCSLPLVRNKLDRRLLDLAETPRIRPIGVVTMFDSVLPTVEVVIGVVIGVGIITCSDNSDGAIELRS